MSTTTFDLVSAASAEMVREGFNPDFPDGTDAQVAQIRASLNATIDNDAQDMRGLLWSSIDNDTSRDLDQIEVADRVDGGIRVRVGIADVSRSVMKGTVIDGHAASQTQTVYTAVKNFSMLPTGLSTDMTSLNENEDRAAHVLEFVVDSQGGGGGGRVSTRRRCGIRRSWRIARWGPGSREPGRRMRRWRLRRICRRS